VSWLRKESKSIAIALAIAFYVLVIATRPYISEPGLAHQLVQLRNEQREAHTFRIPGNSADAQRILNRIKNGDQTREGDEARAARLQEILSKLGGAATEKQVGKEGVQAVEELQRPGIALYP
jgi:hypothetical protein